MEPAPRDATLEPRLEETESARLLANEARDDLLAMGYAEDEIRRLADAFVAAGHEGDGGTFLRWVRQDRGASR